MTVEVNAHLLQSVHSLLRQAKDLQERLDRAPRVIRAAEENAREYEQKVEELRQRIQQTKMKADAKQLQLGEREAHIEKLKTQRNTSESNREYQLLTEQIAADEQANSVLQDEILELLELIDQLESHSEQAKRDWKTLVEQAAKTRQRIEGEMKSVQRDLAEVKADLQEREGQLPGAIKFEYKRLAAAMGEDALAQIDDGSCSHCQQMVSAQTFSQLKMSRAVFCSVCGSLLYIPPANSPVTDATR